MATLFEKKNAKCGKFGTNLMQFELQSVSRVDMNITFDVDF